MTTIDWRSRFAGPAEARTAEQLFAELTDRLAETGTLGGARRGAAGARHARLDIDGTRVHLAVDGDRLVLRDGLPTDAVVAQLDAAACSELFQDVASTFGLLMAGRATFPQGSGDRFVAWEPVLRAARRTAGLRARLDRLPRA